MVMSCAALGCTNRAKKGEGRSFHSFPTNTLLCRKWVVAIKREGFNPSKYSKLCSDHFETCDFVSKFGRKTLNSDAVPSIFKFSNHLQMKLSKQRSQKSASITDTVDEPIVELNTPSTSRTIGCPSPTKSVRVKPVATKSKFRKPSQTVFKEDILPQDLANHNKFKMMWQIANETIMRQKKTITYLRKRRECLTNRVESLNGLANYLKNNNKILFD